MLRYCSNCNKEFEFNPLAITAKEDLICPECGQVIAKNSRKPVDHSGVDRMESKIGYGIAWLMHLSYLFYLIVAIVGIAGYVLRLNMLLYIATGISLVVFLLQLITKTLRFRLGLIFLPAGALAGYFIFNQTIEGACLGVHIVFAVRYVVRIIYYRLIAVLIRIGNE